MYYYINIVFMLLFPHFCILCDEDGIRYYLREWEFCPILCLFIAVKNFFWLDNKIIVILRAFCVSLILGALYLSFVLKVSLINWNFFSLKIVQQKIAILFRWQCYGFFRSVNICLRFTHKWTLHLIPIVDRKSVV